MRTRSADVFILGYTTTPYSTINHDMTASSTVGCISGLSHYIDSYPPNSPMWDGCQWEEFECDTLKDGVSPLAYHRNWVVDKSPPPLSLTSNFTRAHILHPLAASSLDLYWSIKLGGSLSSYDRRKDVWAS